jgi:hypothetical protein
MVMRFGIGRMENPLSLWEIYIPTCPWIGRWMVFMGRIRPCPSWMPIEEGFHREKNDSALKDQRQEIPFKLEKLH